MTRLFRLVVLAACGLAAACASTAPKLHSLESRVAQQSALFEEQYQSDLETHPERATSFGDYRYNDRLDDYSLSAIRRRHDLDLNFLARLQSIPTAGMPEQDVMSHEVMVRSLQQRIDNYDFKEYEMPVNQMDGPHVYLADLPLAVPLDSVRRYDDYIARLHQVPRAFAETEEVMRTGLEDGLMPVRFLLEKVPAQCQGVIDADPFLTPTRNFPDDIPPAERERLTREITSAAVDEVLPAYRQFADFVATQYAPHGRTTLAVTSLPGGERRYLNAMHARTTLVDLSPAEVNRIGVAEIARIEADMLVIARGQGFNDLAAFRESLKTNSKYRAASSEQILDDFRKFIDQMRPKLPELFGFIPTSPITVEAIPNFQSAAATHYQTGTPDGKRPGRVSVATSKFAERMLIDDEATAYHEGIPGHHMQLSVAQLMTGLPKFRQHTSNAGYIEGWALYAEQLGKEVGFYQDPVSDYGRLSSELFRAVRLVVDTGIHSLGWSREQVVDFFRKSAAIDEPTIQSETDRYIAWPAQALAYKLGQLKFRELRARAERELGSKFDVRRFHDQMLNGGVLPLDLLDARTNAWIGAQRAREF